MKRYVLHNLFNIYHFEATGWEVTTQPERLSPLRSPQTNFWNRQWWLLCRGIPS